VKKKAIILNFDKHHNFLGSRGKDMKVELKKKHLTVAMKCMLFVCLFVSLRVCQGKILSFFLYIHLPNIADKEPIINGDLPKEIK
jgi:hypothetical protein